MTNKEKTVYQGILPEITITADKDSGEIYNSNVPYISITKPKDNGKQLYHQGMQRFWQESPIQASDIAFTVIGLGPMGKALFTPVNYGINKLVTPVINKYTFNKFKNSTLKLLKNEGVINPKEYKYLKNVKIKKGNTFTSAADEIVIPKNYLPEQDGGFSLFHELGHQLGNKRGQEFLEQFYSKYGRGYQYSFKLPEGIDKLARNQDELFADWLGFKVGGNKSLNIDVGNVELIGRRNHFRSLKLSNQEKQGIPKSERIVINRHNAPKVSDKQWDIIYEEAVNKNDVNKLQQLRDLHFIIKAPDTKFVTSNGLPQHNYHGGQKGIKVFLNAKDNPNYINTRHQGYRHPETRLGIYFSDNKSIANNYKYNKNGEIYDVYLNAKNPLIQKYSTTLINRLKTYFLKQKSFTPDIIRINDLDGILKNHDAVKHIGVENVIWDNTKIKLANPITYDDMGNFIPLSKRDNFNNFDIRYKKGGKIND